MGENLYINLKASTIIIAALILDIYLTKGLAQLLITMSGMCRAIAIFSEENGEKCIITDVLKTQDKIGIIDLLCKFKGEC